MKFDIKRTGSPTEAEGKHGGYLVKVTARSEIREDRYLVEVYLQKLGAGDDLRKLDAPDLSAKTADDALAFGFALAEREIDSINNP